MSLNKHFVESKVKKYNQKSQVISFDDILDLLDSDMSFVFNTSMIRFENSFSPGKLVQFKQLLSRLTSGKTATEDEYESLLQMRRHAQRLRAFYFMFDINHTIPPDLHKLVVKLGKLKDAIKAEEGVLDQAKKTNKFIDKLLDSDLEQIRNIKKNFISISQIEFHTFLKSHLKEAKDFIEKDGNEHIQLTYKNYHSLRKTIRNFYWLIQFVRKEFNLKGLSELKNFLKETNKNMGAICDQIEQDRFKTGEKYQGTIEVSVAVLNTLEILEKLLSGVNIKSLKI